MKNKTYVMLLLTTTFLIGCGGGAGAGSNSSDRTSSDGQSGTNTSGGGGESGNGQTSSQQAAGKAVTFDALKVLVDRSNTVEEALKSETMQKFIQAFRPAYEAIKDLKRPDFKLDGSPEANAGFAKIMRAYMTKEKRDVFIKNFHTYLEGLAQATFVLKDIALKEISLNNKVKPILSSKDSLDRLKIQPDVYSTLHNEVKKYDYLSDYVAFANKVNMSRPDNALQDGDFYDNSSLPSPEALLLNKEIDNWWKLIEPKYESLIFNELYYKLTPPASLAAGISPSTMARSSRQSTAVVDANQFQVNGVSAGKVEMSLPLSINLKGKIDGSKMTAGTSGTVAYKIGSTVLGVIHAYANKGEGFEVDSHQSETSVAVSQSIGNAFIEGQVGYIGTHEVHNADMTGTRYQLSVGFDTEYVSPFVQVAYRDFGTQADASAYVGAELSIDRLKGDTYALDTNLSAKAGVDSKTEFTGSLEWSASLTLNSGISFKTDLTLGTVEGSTVGLTANISR